MAGATRKSKHSECEGRGHRPPAPRNRLLEGDCLEVMGSLEAGSVDAVVCDPPYAIGFKGEVWDSKAILAAARARGGRLGASEAFQVWAEIWAAECLRVMKPGAFLCAFGSPRTYHRLVCGIEDAGFEVRDTLMWLYGSGMSKSRRYPDGRATTLKPAFEPIVLARRPLEGSTSENLRCHGTGALMVEGSRIGGRLPANVVMSHLAGCEEGRCAVGCPVALADESAAANVADTSVVRPSRIFYCSKASRREREEGCESLPAQTLDLFPNAGSGSPSPNPHPTVKPLGLMRWLVALVCPPGGLVLDPTCGSGTTGCAAAKEGRGFIGIEAEPGFLEVARARIAHHGGGRRPRVEVGRRPLAARRRR